MQQFSVQYFESSSRLIFLGAGFANEGIQIPCLESWPRPGTVIRCFSAYSLPLATFAVTTCCLVLHKQVSHIPSYLLHTVTAHTHTHPHTHGHEMLSVIIIHGYLQLWLNATTGTRPLLHSPLPHYFCGCHPTFATSAVAAAICPCG